VGVDPELRRWLDRQEILDVLARYARAVDRRDWDLLRTCYHPGALDHHTGYDGDVEGFVDFVATVMPETLVTHHAIGQQYVEIDGDAARCESYATNVHRHLDAPDRDYTSGCRYVDRMERRDGRWRIAERFAVRDWTRSDAGRHYDTDVPGPKGRPNREDVVYHLPGWPPAERRTGR
jgi:hypothetical protein